MSHIHAGNGRILWAALLVLAGCGDAGLSKVSGTVLRHDGSPLAGARVVFRAAETGTSANGMTDSNGNYVLGSMTQGDGISPGEYQVYILEDRGGWDSPKPRTINPIYENAKTSGLTCVVEAGKPTTFDIELKK